MPMLHTEVDQLLPATPIATHQGSGASADATPDASMHAPSTAAAACRQMMTRELSECIVSAACQALDLLPVE